MLLWWSPRFRLEKFCFSAPNTRLPRRNHQMHYSQDGSCHPAGGGSTSAENWKTILCSERDRWQQQTILWGGAHRRPWSVAGGRFFFRCMKIDHHFQRVGQISFTSSARSRACERDSRGGSKETQAVWPPRFVSRSETGLACGSPLIPQIGSCRTV